jgi:putative membrane protein
MADTDQTRVRELPSLIVKGFLMGSADVVPGVSGGTMALITGIYQRLINAIKSVDLDVVRALMRLRLGEVFQRVHWFFLAGLLSGVLAAILFFTRVIRLPELMFIHPETVYGLFFGLIVGSVWLVSRDLDRWTIARAGWVLLGALIGLWIVTLVPVDTPETSLFVFFSGSVAITAMILPGISGSFILLILRKYDYILMQFGKLGGSETVDALMVLMPFALGMVTGIVIFSRVLSWLLNRYYNPTLCVLIGFMIGSLYVIWPFQERTYAESVRPSEIALNDPIVAQLRNNPESARAPEYRRLGEIHNDMIVLETVKNKLIGSEPFLPLWSKADSDARLSAGQSSLIQGFLMMLVGLGLVAIIGRLARDKHPA